MTPEEIKSTFGYEHMLDDIKYPMGKPNEPRQYSIRAPLEVSTNAVLVEIAIQLAELNATLKQK